MTLPKIMRPHLERQVKVRSDEDAGKRSKISGDNISWFYTFLYTSIYGGKVKRKNPWGKGLSDQNNSYSFNPDIIRKDGEVTTYTEVKVTSTRSSQIHSRLKQEANYVCRMLEELEAGKAPVIEYAFFKYGTRNLTGLHLLNNSQLVRTLVESEKKLVIVPFNLFLHLTTSSRLETRDQTTSRFSEDSPDYHVIRGGNMAKFLDYETFLEGLHRDISLHRTIPELCLEDIEAENLVVPVVEGHYRTPFAIEAFPVTRYFIPGKKYPRFLESLQAHHSSITGLLGIRDLIAEDVPF